MTPQQHALRAQELAAEAEQTYADLRATVETGRAVDRTLWDFLDTTIRLGQLHATLAQRPPTIAEQHGAPGTRRGSESSAVLPPEVAEPSHVQPDEQDSFGKPSTRRRLS